LRFPRHSETLRAMCNLYSITKGQQAIRDLAGAMRDLTGNLPMMPGPANESRRVRSCQAFRLRVLPVFARSKV
jgi:hypothetical protein